MSISSQAQLAIGRALGYRSVPMMARQTFHYELLGSISGSIGAALLIQEFISIFSIKTLGISEVKWITASLVAQIAAGNFFSAFFAGWLSRRRRRPLIVWPRVAIAVVLFVMALLPPNPMSRWPLLALLIVPAICNALTTNIQSAIWHTNYPETSRGAIFSKLMMLRLLTVGITVKLAGATIEQWPWAYRLVFPAGGLCMLASALAYSKIRVRGERSSLRRAAQERPHPLASFRILRQDKEYARYMLWQMLSGGSVLMTSAIIVQALQDGFGMEYSTGTTSMVLIPMVVQVLAAKWAGRLYDRTNLGDFRALNAGVWALSRGMLLLGLVTRNWWCVLGGFALQGMASSAGAVAWSIGHTRFAKPDQSHLYMAIHMTLQGMRGLTLPFLGAALYGLIGWWVILIGSIAQGLAAVEFYIGRSPAREPAKS